jgi:UDP-glucose:(heptosyl)LPS alpha-1,3-glucosyltransferase
LTPVPDRYEATASVDAPEIGIVRQRYTPYGGAERFVADALAVLNQRGVKLTLYTRAWPGGDGAYRAEVCNPFYVGSLWRDWSFARAVRAAWSRRRPDLVQSHERIAGCDIFRAGDGVHRVWLAERRRGMGIFRRLAISLNPFHRYTLRAEARMFADPALRAVICNSQLVLEQIRECFGLPDTKLRLIYNAVDSKRFSPALRAHRDAARAAHGIPDDACLFVFVGSGYDRKGVAAALAAFAALPGNTWLLVAGKDRHVNRYRTRARRLGVGHRVVFTGPLDDVRPVLGAADAFVLPTLYDPLPNACLEAMAAGLPVVTSAQCGAAELLRAHGGGFVVDALDVAGLSEAMTRLMDPATRWAMGAKSRGAVLPLTSTAMTAQLLGLYESLLADATGSRGYPGR